MKSGVEKMWAGGHLNEMYVGDVYAKQKNTKLGGNLNYDNDVCRYSSDCSLCCGNFGWKILDIRDVSVSGFCRFSQSWLNEANFGKRLG